MQEWLKPMLAEKADTVPEGAGWVIEPKLDGWRCIVFKASGERDGIRLYSGRNGADYTGQLPYLENEVFANLPVGTAIDGELVAPDSFDIVGSIMRSGGAHVPTDARPALSLIAFDLLMVNGQDVREWEWSKRRQLLDNTAFDGAGYVQRTPYISENLAGAHDVFLGMGLEGSVAKRMDSRYVNRKTRLWVKIKPQNVGDCDARIIGFKPGNGDLAGLVGAFIVELLDTDAATGDLIPTGVTTTVKCGTRETHRDATEHPERWLNVVIEIKHHGRNKKTGVPRHPQFDRRRDDRCVR